MAGRECDVKTVVFCFKTGEITVYSHVDRNGPVEKGKWMMCVGGGVSEVVSLIGECRWGLPHRGKGWSQPGAKSARESRDAMAPGACRWTYVPLALSDLEQQGPLISCE